MFQNCMLCIRILHICTVHQTSKASQLNSDFWNCVSFLCKTFCIMQFVQNGPRFCITYFMECHKVGSGPRSPKIAEKQVGY